MMYDGNERERELWAEGYILLISQSQVFCKSRERDCSLQMSNSSWRFQVPTVDEHVKTNKQIKLDSVLQEI